jgi:hypothetical protein
VDEIADGNNDITTKGTRNTKFRSEDLSYFRVVRVFRG